MKKKMKRFICWMLLLGIAVISVPHSNAAVTIPENVRIGLYFGSGASRLFTVNAAKGLQIGDSRSNTFSVLYEEPSANVLTIRKDSYYIRNNTQFTEYTPGPSEPAGEKLGPWHIRLAAGLPDYATALQQAAVFTTQLSMAVYPVYTDGWEVWTGFYASQAAAQKDMTANLAPKLIGIECSVIQTAQNRVIVQNAAGDVLLVYGSDEGHLQIKPKAVNNPYLLTVNNKKYRGDLEVRRFSDSDMTIINILSMDQYLYGVVPPEIGAGAKPEALKAQAVVARTYAVNNLGKYKKWDFNLCNTTASQVYKGFEVESANPSKAVDDTTGQLILLNGKSAAVFFFASSGGRTEDAENVWGYRYNHLVSVEDRYESGKSYHYTWEKSIPAAEIKQRVLQFNSKDIGDVTRMEIINTSDAGRAIEVLITGTKDSQTYYRESTRTRFGLDSQWYTIKTDADISVRGLNTPVSKKQLGGRQVMTASGLKSVPGINNKVKVIGADNTVRVVPTVPTTYTFSGRGWGHAVGMSQEGAMGMAAAGIDYKTILKHYFQGVEVQ